MKEKQLNNPMIIKELTYEELNNLLEIITPEGYKIWRINQIQNKGVFATHSDFELLFVKK